MDLRRAGDAQRLDHQKADGTGAEHRRRVARLDPGQAHGMQRHRRRLDHLAAVQNFVVMPMTFLSGAFYLVENLPEPFATLSHYNPFFYLIDGFRSGFIGHAEGSLAIGAGMSAALIVALGLANWLVFRSGWRLKS